MAYRRKTIIVNPNRDIRQPKKTKPIGLTLPFNNPRGIFFQSYTNKEQVYSNLRNLLLTAVGERYFQPEFGTNIRGVLFENIVDEEEFKNRLKGEIESAITRWLPYLIIQRIDITLNMTDDGRVDDSDHAVGIYIETLISGTNIYLPVRIFISETATLRVEEVAL